jgi:valyl-tRNA synthetase
MEDDLSEAVIDVFIDLYKKGYIYRGIRMVNWDPAGLTAVSDEEVIHKEVQSKLTYVRYVIVDGDEAFDANPMPMPCRKNSITSRNDHHCDCTSRDYSG